MAKHLRVGGVAAIEPWFTPGSWKPGTVHALLVDEPELRIARVSTSLARGRLLFFDLHYSIGTPEGTEHLLERHELGLFTTEEMRSALEHAGLEVGLRRSGRAVRSGFAHRKEGSLIVLAPPGHRSGTHCDQRRSCR